MTRRPFWLVTAALLFGGAARFDSVSRIYAPDVDQRTDVRRYYQGMAESVLAGKGWLPTYPTNFIPPPGQAVFILISKWLSPSVRFQEMRMLQAVISTLTIFLGFRLALRLWGENAGVATAWLLALYFPLTYYVGTLVPETNYIACLFAFALAAAAAQRKPDLWRFALAGGLLGLAVTFKPVPSLLAIALIPWVWMSSAKSSRWRHVLVFVLAAWALPGAWILRNALHYGHVYPVSTNGGVLLALANNPHLDAARSDMIFWDDLYRRADFFRDPEIEQRFAGVIDVDGKPEENLKDRAYARRTLLYMAQNPLHFLRNYMIKLGNFLIYPRRGELRDEGRPLPFREIPFLQDILLGVGLIGLALLVADRGARAAALPLLGLIAYLLLMGALMHLTRDQRMNLPFQALLCLPAGYAIGRLLGFGTPGRPSAL